MTGIIRLFLALFSAFFHWQPNVHLKKPTQWLFLKALITWNKQMAVKNLVRE